MKKIRIYLMKKIRIYLALAFGLIILASGCSKKLDITPVSSVSDASYWKTPDQVDAFVTGVHTRFRSHNESFLFLGEMRSDIYGLEPGLGSSFTGESPQGLEAMWTQTIDLGNPGVSGFGDFYFNINQLNLLINKLNSIDFVTEVNKKYYLGTAYGMRAFYYFQLLRSWGKTVLQTEPVSSINIDNLAKAASSEDEVMKQIKEDLENSINNFGTNYSFRSNKAFWSKAATLMLKGEVYLWTSHRGGGTADATLAKNALTDIQANIPSLTLLSVFADVFSAKGNNEIIFASRYLANEATTGFVSSYFVPQSGLVANFYDSVQNRKLNDPLKDNWGGLLRAPVKVATFRRFNDKDSRKWATLQAGYSVDITKRPSADTMVIKGTFVRKFFGENIAGARSYTNDFPIYRYADLLLLLAETKVFLGEDPSQEINQVRQRAYGVNYNASIHGYPNQVIDASPNDAILQERLFEFIFEGKRWYDLRRMGDAYVYAQIPASKFANSNLEGRLLWPISRTSLTNNKSLVQNPGYRQF